MREVSFFSRNLSRRHCFGQLDLFKLFHHVRWFKPKKPISRDCPFKEGEWESVSGFSFDDPRLPAMCARPGTEVRHSPFIHDRYSGLILIFYETVNHWPVAVVRDSPIIAWTIIAM